MSDSLRACRAVAGASGVLTVEEIRQWLAANPLPARVPDRYQASRLVEGVDYYLEQGLWVFTEWHHRKRGRCCGNGCRHCPWRQVLDA